MGLGPVADRQQPVAAPVMPGNTGKYAPQPISPVPGITHFSGDASLAGAQTGSAPSETAGRTGVKTQWGWDQAIDTQLAPIDQQIATLNKYQGTGAYQPDQVQQLQSQRAQLNVQRWKQADLSANPGAQWVQQQIKSGALTWEDLGGVDASMLQGDGAALAGSVTQLLASKAAGPPAPPEDPYAQGAKDATAGVMDDTLSHVQSYLTNPLAQFDKSTQQSGAGISSVATHNASHMGLSGAESQANTAGTNLQANASTGRAAVEQNGLDAVHKYISDTLTSAENQGQDVANMDVGHRVQLQTASINALGDAVKTAISKGQIQAGAEADQLQGAINDWLAKVKSKQEDTAEKNKVFGLVLGTAMAAGGAAMAIGSGGTLAVPGALLGAAGAGKIASS